MCGERREGVKCMCEGVRGESVEELCGVWWCEVCEREGVRCV